ncbi:hypothetical protein COCC4DRAFT_55687 [Bipolaris maydis ATCC 48331]|uniref:Uncharacterized protein n=2 Tax=Cochliobolus heterostrophus TaxID=5016 RepID=M2TFD4_COCH5|nr:uncharacterized protein COCC4DRAFT_55687 [Bipolaris maydis ATCC 48331]EMD96165.1 hypothetical protein COCHEDRAFT_1088224 [Bipolaris maydis C5]ENI11024.1 hypothetical protein COCC4DRAFT_55687 [Bipolaris maydis ATCC 48331]KAH7562014.1 hypothetical protein BM1_03118 [Bipolaris maydis]
MADKPMYVRYSHPAMTHPRPTRRLPTVIFDSFEAQGQQGAPLEIFLQRQQQLQEEMDREGPWGLRPAFLPTSYTNSNAPLPAVNQQGIGGCLRKKAVIANAQGISRAREQSTYFAELALLEAGLSRLTLEDNRN